MLVEQELRIWICLKLFSEMSSSLQHVLELHSLEKIGIMFVTRLPVFYIFLLSIVLHVTYTCFSCYRKMFIYPVSVLSKNVV